MRHKSFEGEALNGTGLAWGVQTKSEIVYEAMFCRATATRLAQLCNKSPEQGWDKHSMVLEAEGYSLTDPAVLEIECEKLASAIPAMNGCRFRKRPPIKIQPPTVG